MTAKLWQPQEISLSVLPSWQKNNKNQRLYPFIIYAWKRVNMMLRGFYMSKVSVEKLCLIKRLKISSGNWVTEVIYS